MILLGVALAAAVGAPARYLLDGWLQERLQQVFPWGTFVINVSGSLLLGLLTGLVLYGGFPQTSKVVLGTGFCGAYTTFSTFSWETVVLAEEGSRLEALGNTVGSVVVGLAAAAAGLLLAAGLT